MNAKQHWSSQTQQSGRHFTAQLVDHAYFVSLHYVMDSTVRASSSTRVWSRHRVITFARFLVELLDIAQQDCQFSRECPENLLPNPCQESQVRSPHSGRLTSNIMSTVSWAIMISVKVCEVLSVHMWKAMAIWKVHHLFM